MELYPDLQEQYLADPKSGKCPFFYEGQEFMVENEDFFRMLNGKFCSEAWDSISRYIQHYKVDQLCMVGQMMIK
jgi:uncharacterized repeat protein (TIGR04076 family)